MKIARITISFKRLHHAMKLAEFQQMSLLLLQIMFRAVRCNELGAVSIISSEICSENIFVLLLKHGALHRVLGAATLYQNRRF